MRYKYLRGLIISICLMLTLVFISCVKDEGKENNSSFVSTSSLEEMSSEENTCEESSSEEIGEEQNSSSENEEDEKNESIDSDESGEEASSSQSHEHEFVCEVVEEVYLKAEATCQNQAAYFKSCICGEMGDSFFYYGEIGECNYVDGVCSVCTGEKQSEGLEYALLDNCYAVIGIGECTDVDLRIPEKYNDLPVTNIGANAFAGKAQIISVSIPASITQMGQAAFYNCVNLSKVYYKGQIEDWCNITFEDSTANPINCSKSIYINGKSVKELIIPEGVYTINAFAFAYCEDLESVMMSDNITTIGDEAFAYCTNLKNAAMGKNIVKIGVRAFCFTGLTEISIPDGITEIEQCVFDNCKVLTKITWGKGVATIGWRAFANCESLTEVCFPESLRSISIAAFTNCTSLNSVAIQEGLLSIEQQAFYSCTKLEGVSIPNSVNTIGQEAFAYCENLTSLTLPSGIEKIEMRTFYFCTALSKVVIPENVTTIGQSAFEGCSGMQWLTISNSVDTMEKYAFSGCNKLSSVTFKTTGKWKWHLINHNNGIDATLNQSDLTPDYNGAYQLKANSKYKWSLYRY